MQKFKFFIQKYYAWYPRVKKHEKQIIIEATDLVEARKTVERLWPTWEVSMFWPVTKRKT